MCLAHPLFYLETINYNNLMAKAKSKADQRIENFLKAMAKDIPGRGENWPQSASQMAAYFDADQSIDMFWRIDKLLKEGMSYKELGKLFQYPTMLRYFIVTDLIGLKIANSMGIKKISIKQRLNHFDNLVKTLETMF